MKASARLAEHSTCEMTATLLRIDRVLASPRHLSSATGCHCGFMIHIGRPNYPPSCGTPSPTRVRHCPQATRQWVTHERTPNRYQRYTSRQRPQIPDDRPDRLTPTVQNDLRIVCSILLAQPVRQARRRLAEPSSGGG